MVRSYVKQKRSIRFPWFLDRTNGHSGCFAPTSGPCGIERTTYDETGSKRHVCDLN